MLIYNVSTDCKLMDHGRTLTSSLLSRTLLARPVSSLSLHASLVLSDPPLFSFISAVSADIGGVDIQQAVITNSDGLAIAAAMAADPTVTISEFDILSSHSSSSLILRSFFLLQASPIDTTTPLTPLLVASSRISLLTDSLPMPCESRRNSTRLLLFTD